MGILRHVYVGCCLLCAPSTPRWQGNPRAPLHSGCPGEVGRCASPAHRWPVSWTRSWCPPRRPPGRPSPPSPTLPNPRPRTFSFFPPVSEEPDFRVVFFPLFISISILLLQLMVNRLGPKAKIHGNEVAGSAVVSTG